MKLGFVSAVFPDLTLPEVVEFAASAGYSCVELMCWPRSPADRRYAGVTHVDVTEFDKAQADGVRESVSAAGVAISGLGYYPNLLSPDRAAAEQCAEHLRKVISAAALLGVHQVNTFVGRDWTKSIDDNWPRFLDVWRPLVKFAEHHRVRIGIENCPMLYTHDEWPGGKNLAYCPKIWRRMFADIPSDWFGLNYDPSHLIWQQIDYLQPLWEFASRIFHVHAKDARLDRNRLNDVGILATPLEFHTPKLPGLGDVDWGRFISILSDVGYRGPLCVEVEDRAHEDSLASRQAALRQCRNFLSAYLPGRVG